MKTLGPNLWRVLGWNTQGDLGPYTTWTDKRGNLVVAIKHVPAKAPSSAQIACRDRFALAHVLWRSLAPEQREAWTRAGAAAGLRISGYNLYISTQLTGDTAAARTVFHQAGLPPGVF